MSGRSGEARGQGIGARWRLLLAVGVCLATAGALLTGCSVIFLQHNGFKRNAIHSTAPGSDGGMRVAYGALPLSPEQRRFLDGAGALKRRIYAFEDRGVLVAGMHLKDNHRKRTERYGAALVFKNAGAGDCVVRLGLGNGFKFSSMDPGTANQWVVRTIDAGGVASQPISPGDEVVLSAGTSLLFLAEASNDRTYAYVVPEFAVYLKAEDVRLGTYRFNGALMKPEREGSEGN